METAETDVNDAESQRSPQENGSISYSESVPQNVNEGSYDIPIADPVDVQENYEQQDNVGYYDENGNYIYYNTENNQYQEYNEYNEYGEYENEGGEYDEHGSVVNNEYDEYGIKVIKRVREKKKLCQECFHKHEEGIFCHCFIEDLTLEQNANDDDDNDFASSAENSAEKFVSIIEHQASKVGTKKGDEILQPLETPFYVKRIGFIRCNCNFGIPVGVESFVPMPKPYLVGDITVNVAQRVKDYSPKDLTVEQHDKYCIEIRKSFATMLSSVYSYLQPKHLAHSANVCQDWNMQANTYLPYKDIRDMTPWQVLKPHNQQVNV